MFMKNIYHKGSIIIKFSIILILLSLNLKSFTQSPDSKGVDFWLTFPGNLGAATGSFFITGEENTTGTVSVPGLGFSTPFSVTAGAVTTVVLPSTVFISLSNTIMNNGVHVVSEKEITVYGLNRVQFTTDAYLALPTDILGTDYINLGFGNVNILNGTQLGIVATQDATLVSITPTVTTDGHTVGVPYVVNLNQGQTYLLRNTDPSPNDLSGTFISSDKPIAVFGSHQCANVPNGNTFACDYLVEQLPPISAWGKNFVSVPLKTRLNGDTYRFLASEDNTIISVNGVSIGTINKGHFIQTILTTSSQITSSAPILVAQYSNGTTYDNVTSDPFMMLIFPYEQFLNSYTITTPASGFQFNYVNIVAPTAAVGAIKMDGTAIPSSEYTPIGSSGFSGAQLNLSIGAHNFNGTNLPFGVFVYGFDQFDSYGYPGGGSLSPIATVNSISISPKTGSALINTETCFDAIVKDQFETPVSGVRVDFTITGPNSASTGFANTDANGVAHFCYIGTIEGNDNITASIGTFNDAASFIWVNTCYVVVSAKKFYDLNTDGIDNDGITVQNWNITFSGTDENSNNVGPVTQSTNVGGITNFTSIAKGTYTIAEGAISGWINTKATSVTLNISECTDPGQIKFGNVCIGPGTNSPGTFGIGYWANKNGQSLITGPYLCELNALCLRNANGSDFDPVAGCPTPSNTQLNAGRSALKGWMQSATATNMSYMLSAQLAAMKLNVLKGYVNGSKLIYAPGTVSANIAGFASVNVIMTEANNFLCANPIISSGNSLLPTAEAIKNALDKANNNLNFVQSQPCEVSQTAVIRSSSEQLSEQLKQSETTKVNVYPNPSHSYFLLDLHGFKNELISIRVTDVVGKLIEIKKVYTLEQIIKVGEHYKPGVYILQVIQGEKQKTIKIIKQ